MNPRDSKPQVLFIYPTISTFVEVDKHILESRFSVQTLCLDQAISRLRYVYKIACMKFRILTSPAKLIVIWFSDYHAVVAVLLARLLGKKSVIFVGGYDAVCYPALGMGVYTSRLRGFCASMALKLCDRIIVNHAALVRSQNFYYDPKGHREGILNLVPGLRTPINVVHNAITTKAPINLNEPRKEQFLCVGSIPRFNDIINKGWDLVINVAKARPEWSFVIVGMEEVWLNKLEKLYAFRSLPNLLILPRQPHNVVLEMMRESKYFIQASISEGMPNALMEAMLMGCVPVGSNVSGIPLIMGTFGVVFTRRDPASLEEALEKAVRLKHNPIDVSNSVQERFPLRKRAAGVLNILDDLLES
jgi:glycosyltransferase involved in cell wall biosynthesis